MTPQSRMDLTDVYEELLDDRVKGVPGHTPPVRLADVPAQGWNVFEGDLPLPLLTIRRSRLENNISTMQAYCDAQGVALAPHGKTTMAPQIFQMQLDAGAWGITAATVQQLHVYRRFGVPRVLFANELVGDRAIEYVCRELKLDPAFELLLYVDSIDGARMLAKAAERHAVDAALPVLLEVGYRGGRTGVRTQEEGLELSRAILDLNPRLQLAGVAGFEGLLPIERFRAGDEAPARNDATERMTGYLESVGHIIDLLLEQGALKPEFIVTAGGSAAFDHVVHTFGRRWKGATVVLRSGCYVTHDHGMYWNASPLSQANARGPGLRGAPVLEPALELWSHVLSRPEPELALLGFGRRDASFDYGLPIPLFFTGDDGRTQQQLPGGRITQLNDQHAYLEIDASSTVAIGDRVVCGISHPCTVFDKWRVIPIIEEDGQINSAIRTFF